MLFIRKTKQAMLLGVMLSALIVRSCPAAPLENADNYFSIGQGVATVYYRAEDSKVAHSYLGWAEAYKPRPEWLSASSLASLSIYIAPTQQEFINLSGGLLPEWGVACAIPGTDIIIVRSPRIVEHINCKGVSDAGTNQHVSVGQIQRS